MGAEKVLLSNQTGALKRRHPRQTKAAFCSSVTIAGLAALRLARRMQTDRLGVLEDLRKQADIVTVKAGWKRLVFVFSASAAREILVDHPHAFRKGLGLDEARVLFGDGLLTADGKTWHSGRKSMASFFNASNVPTSVSATHKAVAAELNGIGELPAAVSARDLATTIALRAIGDSAFGRTFQVEERHELTDALSVLTAHAGQRMTAILKLPLLLPIPGHRRVHQARSVLQDWADGEINAARTGLTKTSFLSSLMETGTTDRQQLRDEALTILMAGHETVAATLSFALLHVARDPELQTCLRSELHTRCHGRKPEAEDLTELPWIRATIEETLRLHPPVWMIPRRAIRSVLITGAALPVGTDVLIPIWALHRSERFWVGPATFRPARFLDPSERRRGASAYMPFGAGPRTCIGRRQGLAESMLALCSIVSNFRLEPGTPPVPSEEFSSEQGLTLLPAPEECVVLAARCTGQAET